MRRFSLTSTRIPGSSRWPLIETMGISVAIKHAGLSRREPHDSRPSVYSPFELRCSAPRLPFSARATVMIQRALPLLTFCLAASVTACVTATPPDDEPPTNRPTQHPRGQQAQPGELDIHDVRNALDANDLEVAHAALTSILSRRFLNEAHAKLEAQDFEAGWLALERALEFTPKNQEALELKEATTDRFFEALVSQAELALTEGRPEDALALSDRALELQPDASAALLQRGRGFFDLGRKVSNAAFIEDSLTTFVEAAAKFDDAQSWLGASQAAYNLARTEEALDYARRAREKLGDQPTPAALRTIAESTFGAYRSERQAQPDSDDCKALFEETQDILYQLIGIAPETAWAWRELANLMSWQGYTDEARTALEQGLAQVPTDTALHARFQAVVKQAGGAQALLDYYEAFARRHPAIAIGRFNAGLARFELGLEQLLARPEGEEGVSLAEHLTEEFRTAEADFVRAREIDESLSEAATGYEIVTRDALGWSYYHSGNLDAARDAFLSMEDLLDGGLRWELEGSLLSGVTSLEFVAGAFFASQQDASMSDLEKARGMEKAAKIFDFLHEYEPEVIKWANNSGFFNRDVAVMLHDEARNIEAKLEREELGEEQAAALAVEGRTMLARARELMDKSYRAYVDTSKLAPEDVRIVNDTGLILTYYLERDLDVAEEYLLRAVALGEQQTLDESLAADARYELENALGDAYQNLGVLHLKLTGNVELAKEWLEKSLAIGPDPRPTISRVLLPKCEAALAGELHAPLVDETGRWSRPFRAPEKQ